MLKACSDPAGEAWNCAAWRAVRGTRRFGGVQEATSEIDKMELTIMMYFNFLYSK